MTVIRYILPEPDCGQETGAKVNSARKRASKELLPPGSNSREESKHKNNFDQSAEDSKKTQSISSEESFSGPLESKTPGSEHVLGIFSSAILQLKDTLLQGLIDHATAEEAMDGMDGSQKRAREPSSSNSSQASDQPPHKRLREKGQDPGDGDDGSGDDNDDSDPPKRKERRSPFGSSRRLKCPFYQREPEKYSRAACRGEGFADMAKLKDHIKRVHTQPLRCARCWKDMASEDAYIEHQQAEISCAKRCQPVDDRITQRTLKRLDFKKAPYAYAKDTEQKWRLMYKEIFPNDQEAPSPYDQHGFTPRLEKVLYEALEEELTRELAPALEPIMQRIRDRIPFIIQSCKEKLLRESPDSTGTPKSGMTASSEDLEDSSAASQPADFYRRHADDIGSDNIPSKTLKKSTKKPYFSKKAQGKQPQKGGSCSPSAESTTDDFPESRHSSSPDSIFDNPATSCTDNVTSNSLETFNADEFVAAGRSISVSSLPASFSKIHDAPSSTANISIMSTNLPDQFASSYCDSPMEAPHIIADPTMLDINCSPAALPNHTSLANTNLQVQEGSNEFTFLPTSEYMYGEDFNFDAYFDGI